MPGFNPLTATKEEKLAEIKRINKDFKKAGITPMTEEEMEELASDTARVELYTLAQDTAAKIRARDAYEKNKVGYIYPVSLPFDRSRHYIFNIEDSDAARAENAELSARISTVSGTKSYLREVYEKLLSIDETEFYAKDLKDQIKKLSTDTGFKMFAYELDGVFSAGMRLDDQVLSTEEYARFRERLTLYQTLNFYVCNVKAMSSPYYLLMPHRSNVEYVMLMQYYAETNQMDKWEYLDACRGLPATLDDFKYGKIAAELMKAKGFMGVPQENVTYESYDDKGRKVSGRSTAIDMLINKESASCRIVKHITTEENGQKTVTTSEMTLTRDEIVKTYGYNKLYEKYPHTRDVQLSADERVRDIQTAILLHYMPTVPKVDDGDEEQKKKNDKKIAEFIAAVLDGSDDIYAYFITQSQEEQDKMVVKLLGDEKHVPKEFDRGLKNFLQDKYGISFAKAESMIEEAHELYEEEVAELECYMDYPDKNDYQKMIKRLIENAKAQGISNSLFDDIVQDISKYCLTKSGVEEKNAILAISKLGKVEEKLAKQMLSDDSEKLRKEYAFVVNLQSKLEGYLDAGEFSEEAKDPTSIYASAYDRAKYRMEKLEQAAKNIDEKTSREFKNLTLLAKESMDNIRKAIVAEAVGKKEQGIASLKDGRDIGILSMYHMMLASEEDDSLRVVLKRRGAEKMVEELQEIDSLKEKCQNLTLQKVGELLEDSRKFGEFITKSEKPEVTNSGVQMDGAKAGDLSTKSEEQIVKKLDEQVEGQPELEPPTLHK